MKQTGLALIVERVPLSRVFSKAIHLLRSSRSNVRRPR